MALVTLTGQRLIEWSLKLYIITFTLFDVSLQNPKNVTFVVFCFCCIRFLEHAAELMYRRRKAGTQAETVVVCRCRCRYRGHEQRNLRKLEFEAVPVADEDVDWL